MDQLPEFEDLRTEALRAVRDLQRVADRFPKGEPARKILRNAANRLRIVYSFTGPQKKRLILKAIVDGYQRFDELEERLSFTNWDLRGLLAGLVDKGYISERRISPAGGPGGRPYKQFTLTKTGQGSIVAGGFGEQTQNLDSSLPN